jgi:hypothetical protein
MEASYVQVLMFDKLACSMQAIERTCIIENLLNSLSHKVGALKKRWDENMTDGLQYNDF